MKHQSSLLPYKNEIVTLRRQNPPMPYAQIAELLHEKYHIKINREAIFKFVKTCATTRKKIKNKSYKPCTYAHKIKLNEATQLIPVEANSQPIPKQKIAEPTPTPNSLEDKSKEDYSKPELDSAAERKAREARWDEKVVRWRKEKEEREAKWAREEIEKKQAKEKARLNSENWITSENIPSDLVDKLLWDMKCEYDMEANLFYHLDMAVAIQARLLVQEALNQKTHRKK